MSEEKKAIDWPAIIKATITFAVALLGAIFGTQIHL